MENGEEAAVIGSMLVELNSAGRVGLVIAVVVRGVEVMLAVLDEGTTSASAVVERRARRREEGCML